MMEDRRPRPRGRRACRPAAGDRSRPSSPAGSAVARWGTTIVDRGPPIVGGRCTPPSGATPGPTGRTGPHSFPPLLGDALPHPVDGPAQLGGGLGPLLVE